MGRVTAIRGMAHFPVSGPNACWQCVNFMRASDPERGRCQKYIEFVGKSYLLDDRFGGDPNWWRDLPTISGKLASCKYFNAIQWDELLYGAVSEEEWMSRPNRREAGWIKRIASSPLMVTKSPEETVHYSLQDGSPVPPGIARRLITKGWLKAQRDGLFDEPQTYRARTP